MAERFDPSSFYQPQARMMSLRRLEALNGKAELICQGGYKDAFISKHKGRYLDLLVQREGLRRRIAALPEADAFDPVMAAEATEKLLARKERARLDEVQRQLREFEQAEDAELVRLVPRETAELFKNFNRDQILTKLVADQSGTPLEIRRPPSPARTPTESRALAEFFTCNNRKLTAKLFGAFFKAYAENLDEIVEALLEDLLREEVGSKGGLSRARRKDRRGCQAGSGPGKAVCVRRSEVGAAF